MLQEPRLPAAQAVRTQENKHENNSLLSGAERSPSPQRHRMICGAPGRGSRRSPAAAFHRGRAGRAGAWQAARRHGQQHGQGSLPARHRLRVSFHGGAGRRGRSQMSHAVRGKSRQQPRAMRTGQRGEPRPSCCGAASSRWGGHRASPAPPGGFTRAPPPLGTCAAPHPTTAR